MDHSYRNSTRSSPINGGFMFRSFNFSSSLRHHNLSRRSLVPIGTYPPPCRPSLPSSSRQQPPLLPLPGSEPTSAPSPTKGTVILFHQHKHQRRRRRPPATPRNGKAVLVRAQKSKVETWEEKREEREEDDATETIYSISPPPSSLPLPRFSLPRPKTAASCVTEAMGGGEIDIGATDGLRRLLRL